MKKIQIVLLVIIFIGLGLIFTQKYWVPNLVDFILKSERAETDQPIIYGVDPLNTTYIIKGLRYPFTNGIIEREIVPGSASKQIIRVFGEPVYGDLNGDGAEDAALFITDDNGGSGTFFYVVEAINIGGKYRGTNAMFLGDRIAPQNINIIDGRAVANFAVRKAGEPFTTPPSVGKSVWVYLDEKNMEMGEWVKDFEGESAL